MQQLHYQDVISEIMRFSFFVIVFDSGLLMCPVYDIMKQSQVLIFLARQKTCRKKKLNVIFMKTRRKPNKKQADILLELFLMVGLDNICFMFNVYDVVTRAT